MYTVKIHKYVKYRPFLYNYYVIIYCKNVKAKCLYIVFRLCAIYLV